MVGKQCNIANKVQICAILIIKYIHAVDQLPVKPEKTWLNMDKLEPEKLEWMRDLPAPKKQGTKKVKIII